MKKKKKVSKKVFTSLRNFRFKFEILVNALIADYQGSFLLSYYIILSLQKTFILLGNEPLEEGLLPVSKQAYLLISGLMLICLSSSHSFSSFCRPNDLLCLVIFATLRSYYHAIFWVVFWANKIVEDCCWRLF